MVAVLTEAGMGQPRDVVEASIFDTVSWINREIEKHARIGAVLISTEPWTVENGILTPTLKFKRDKIDELYGDQGEQLARTAAEQGQVLVQWV